MTAARSVRPFVDLDSAAQDRDHRGACILFDLHGLWWSVPTELTIHQVNGQIIDECARLDIAPFSDQYRTVGNTLA